MDISDIDPSPPETVPHHGNRHDARAATPRRWEPLGHPRETDEHEESHLVRGYD